MNFEVNNKLCLSVESRIEIELEKSQLSASEKFFFSESKFDFLVEAVCKSFDVIHDINILLIVLKLYSGRVIACNDHLNIYDGYSEYNRPQILLLLKKSWVISIGICKRIEKLETNFIEKINNYCNQEDSKDILTCLSCLLLPFLIFSKSRLNGNLLPCNFKEKLSLLDEIKLGSRFRCLKFIQDEKYIHKPTEELIEKKITKTDNKKSIPKLASEINLLNTLEQRTLAILNMITFDENGFGYNKILNINNHHLIFNLWEEYISIGSEECLISEIIETKNLPSMCLKCEILFIITTYSREGSTFEKVIKIIISKTSKDHKIMHYICNRWQSLLGEDKIEYISKESQIQAIKDYWKNMRILIWEFQILVPLVSKNVPYFIKLQSIALSYYLISNFVQTDEIIYEYSQEIESMNKVLQVLSNDIINIIKGSVLHSFVLERSVLPRISAFSENTIFSCNLINLISSIANIDLGEDANKAVYYQLVSNMLCDPYLTRHFSFEGESGLIDMFRNILDLDKLLVTDNLIKFIYLFGQIPSEIITTTLCQPSFKNQIKLPFLNTFSPRMVKNSNRYSNSLRFTETFSGIIKIISQSNETNIKVILLFLADLVKKLYNQHLANSRSKIVNQDQNKSDQIDFCYSYIILYKYLNHCFEKYNNYIDEHATMALKSVTKPEIIIPKNMIFIL
ncbi:uncharacterized protein cubi_00493 [Cryptosporidium ubiquitum]|uniref:Uncharacterized protein n=1 Tax=Cryptosporidium ubiquitum TaxID=857276 RepID=A0A1J4ME28_9CRYT|nr:uncharacterized protein cubi_00493 [Cryptosporidium ubiquitum]OII72498.1 hypothetical protein cubi_00493 [Cryptosporidium ubiquitum]